MLAFIRPVFAVTMTAALVPVLATAGRAQAHQAVPCEDDVLGSVWWCAHYSNTPIYQDPNLHSAKVGNTGPDVRSRFRCRIDNGGPSGSPVHPNRWLELNGQNGWLPDGKLTSETDPVPPARMKSSAWALSLVAIAARGSDCWMSPSP